MQTFMPHTDSFERIARELDNKRLHKQTLEGWQVLLAITKLDPNNQYRDPKGWANHPVANMWRGYETALVAYLSATYFEWIGRGFKSTMLEKIYSTYDYAVAQGIISDKMKFPPWIQDSQTFEELASTHRVALLVKDYEWYSQFGWPEDTGTRPTYYQYLWPDAQGNLYLGTYNAA
jgi:hypothetical protein